MIIVMVGSERKRWSYDNAVNAQQKMRSGEEAAAKEVAQTADDTNGTREAEDVAPINYTGSGEGKVEKKAKGRGFLKSKGALGFIMALILGGGGLMMGSQSLMPFSLLSQLSETFDSIKVSTELRSNTMWDNQLANKKLTNPLHKKYFGFGGDTFKVRSKQKNKLKTQGIYVQDNFGGSGKSVMLFDDGSGSLKIVAAGDADIGTLKNLDVSGIDLSTIDADVDLSHMQIDTDNIMTFKAAYADVADFRNGYIKSSRTWRGSVSAWFDSITVRFLQSNRLTRNRFKTFQERVQAEQAGNTRSAAKKATVDLMEADIEELEVTTRTTDSEFDNDGNPVKTTDSEGNTVKATDSDGNTGTVPGKNGTIEVDEIDSTTTTKTGSIKTKTTKAEIKAKMDEIKNGKLGKASGYVSAAVNVACTVFDVIGAINLLIAAQETIQVVQIATSYFEAIDKVKAGDGEGSPVHTLAEGLTTPKATTIIENTTNDKSILESSGDIDTREVIAEGKENTTAMQSSGIAALYSGTRVNANDASVQNFNIGARFSTILGYLGSSLTSFASCAIAKAAAAVADMVIDIVAIATCAVSFGIGCVIDAIGESVTTAGVSIAIGLAATFAINVITPLAVKAFTRDLVSELAGEDLGNALVSGANVYMGQNHLQGGGSLATEKKYVAYAVQQKEVIAEQARYERETKSPFDITSQYTFAGSILRQVAALSTMPSSLFGILGTAAGMISSSITAILPSASAYDIASTLPSTEAEKKEFETNCPYLASVNAVGDAFCNPYFITDTSTITMDPLAVVDKVSSNLEDDGSIKKGTNLANYVLYCSQRSSAFGVADANIANAFSPLDVDTGNSTVNTVANGAIGSVPVVGDLLDVINNGDRLLNTGWITGQSCVASDESLESDGTVFGVSWSENKYYQRFVEDQRLLESLDDKYTSVVTAFLDEYYEENPLDNSYEGILARKSGLTKDQVIALLDTIEYWDYIANYDPSTRYWTGEEQVVARRLDFGGEMIGESKTVIILETPVWDRRQRNIAVA